jgi:fatty-acyl-CoA synthase
MNHSAPDLPNFHARRIPEAIALSDGDVGTFDELTHILYTSGTTGRPKGALSTHGTIFWQTANLSLISKLSRPGHMLCPIPLFHAGGLLTCAMPLLYHGGRVTTMRRFDATAVLKKLIEPNDPITHLSQIPAMYSAIGSQPGFESADLSNLRCCIIAGAIAQPDLIRIWSGQGARMQPQYPSVAVGYWRREKSDYFAPGDWLRTGDVARRDADGYHYFTGRAKEMYKSGGENVYPAEVELILAPYPDVVDIAVVGIPDDRWGEVGMAVIVPAPGKTVTLESLREFGSAQLARYKLPQRLVLVGELQRNVTGKVQRQELVKMYGPTT